VSQKSALEFLLGLVLEVFLCLAPSSEAVHNIVSFNNNGFVHEAEDLKLCMGLVSSPAWLTEVNKCSK